MGRSSGYWRCFRSLTRGSGLAGTACFLGNLMLRLIQKVSLGSEILYFRYSQHLQRQNNSSKYIQNQNKNNQQKIFKVKLNFSKNLFNIISQFFITDKTFLSAGSYCFQTQHAQILYQGINQQIILHMFCQCNCYKGSFQSFIKTPISFMLCLTFLNV